MAEIISTLHTKPSTKLASIFQPKLFQLEKYVNKRRFVAGGIRLAHEEFIFHGEDKKSIFSFQVCGIPVMTVTNGRATRQFILSFRLNLQTF